MTNDPVLGMLGLSRKAGKLAPGDEMTCDACAEGKARAVFLASDAGSAAAKKAEYYAEKANVPLIRLPHSKEALGAAIGKSQSAVCAVTDIGLAASVVQKLAAQDAAFADAARLLAEKNTRIQSRKGRKKDKSGRSANEQNGETAGADTNTKPKFTTEVSANGNRK